MTPDDKFDKQIEHDPEENPEVQNAYGRQYLFATCAPMFAGISIWAHPVGPTDWRDWTALLVFYFLILWILGPTRAMRANGNAGGHQGAAQRLAFLAGKKLNRVLNHFHR